MNIEHLSHWSGQLNREMYLNRYGLDMQGFLLWSLLHQVGAITSTMTLV